MANIKHNSEKRMNFVNVEYWKREAKASSKVEIVE